MIMIKYINSMKRILQIFLLVLIFTIVACATIVVVFDPIWICKIQSNECYDWYHGIWHGLWAIAHFIRDCFQYTKCISNNGNTWYYVCYWVTFVLAWSISIYTKFFLFNSKKE